MNVHPYTLVDAHCDTLCELWQKGGCLRQNDHVLSLEKLSAYRGYIQFFAVWLDDAAEAPLQDALQMMDIFYRELEENKEDMLQIVRATDFERALRQGKIGAMLTVENGRALAGSLANLRLFYCLGVRALTLTWNGANELADGILEPGGGGLTDFGRAVVREMNRLGMIIDVSHLSVQAFWEVLEASSQPVMASHSNALAVAGHPRNLSDEQIRALAGRGGVIGLNLYPAFLSDSGSAGVQDCLRHIEHIANVGGEDCVGLGSDFDGFGGPMPASMEGPQDYDKLFAALEQAGYSAPFLRKLSCENWIRFAKKILK